MFRFRPLGIRFPTLYAANNYTTPHTNALLSNVANSHIVAKVKQHERVNFCECAYLGLPLKEWEWLVS